MKDEIKRRNRLDLMSPAELAIFNAMQEVEKTGADERLTEATILLDKARGAVADFIDNVKRPVEQPEKSAEAKITEGYELIPMSEITDEARKIAVAWMECDDKNWIGQKHKLASDIMNYAVKYASQFRKPLNIPTEDEIKKAGGVYEKEYEEAIHPPDIPYGAVWANEDFDAGARWAIAEIQRRNK